MPGKRSFPRWVRRTEWSAETCDQRQIIFNLVHQPLNVKTTVFAQHLGELWFLRATLQSVGREQFCWVFDSPLALCSRVHSIDSACCLRRVATTERRLVQQHAAPTVFQQGVGCWHTSQTNPRPRWTDRKGMPSPLKWSPNGRQNLGQKSLQKSRAPTRMNQMCKSSIEKNTWVSKSALKWLPHRVFLGKKLNNSARIWLLLGAHNPLLETFRNHINFLQRQSFDHLTHNCISRSTHLVVAQFGSCWQNQINRHLDGPPIFWNVPIFSSVSEQTLSQCLCGYFCQSSVFPM